MLIHRQPSSVFCEPVFFRQVNWAIKTINQGIAPIRKETFYYFTLKVIHLLPQPPSLSMPCTKMA